MPVEIAPHRGSPDAVQHHSAGDEEEGRGEGDVAVQVGGCAWCLARTTATTLVMMKKAKNLPNAGYSNQITDRRLPCVEVTSGPPTAAFLQATSSDSPQVWLFALAWTGRMRWTGYICHAKSQPTCAWIDHHCYPSSCAWCNHVSPANPQRHERYKQSQHKSDSTQCFPTNLYLP